MDLRFRVLLEPRGFIRVLEWLLAIIAFGTTGGFNTSSSGSVKCNGAEPEVQHYIVPVYYSFNLEEPPITVPNCTLNNGSALTWGTNMTAYLEGNFSPTSQWFVFVGVMAFLFCMAAVVFYVAFEADLRQTHERTITITDFVATIIFTFLWLTAAASWAWGVGQVKTYGSPNGLIKNEPVASMCAIEGVTCMQTQPPDYSKLNASVAFAFLSFFVWASNIWFVYKETPYHEDNKNTGTEGPNQQVPGNQD